MKNRVFLATVVLGLALGCSGCAKQADPNRPLDQIQKEVETMSVQDLEKNAQTYAEALKVQKAELDKIKAKMVTLPVDKIFSNNFMTNKISKIGRKAEALFERYLVYVVKLREKGADLSRVQLD